MVSRRVVDADLAHKQGERAFPEGKAPAQVLAACQTISSVDLDPAAGQTIPT